MPALRSIFTGLALIVAGPAAPAAAHPHVWVTIQSEVVYGDDGAANAVRHRWTFDEMFSAFATQGMDTKKPGGLTREDLAPLAEVNVSSLKEFDYFTSGRVTGKPVAFKAPVDYWVEQNEGRLVLNFTLPFSEPVKAKRFEVTVSDPSWFVDFSLAPQEPARLVNAPAGCRIAAQGGNSGASPSQPVDESFFEGPAGARFGAQFANRIAVSCP